MEYTNRAVRSAKAAYLSSEYLSFVRRPPAEGAMFTIGKTSYCFEGGRWFTMVPVRPPVAEFTACVVYGTFVVPRTGHNFVAVKFPAKSNWHKVIAPALYRLLKRVAGAAREDVMNTDALSYEKGADQLKAFAALKGPAKFVFRGGEFACVWRGTKKP